MAGVNRLKDLRGKDDRDEEEEELAPRDKRTGASRGGRGDSGRSRDDDDEKGGRTLKKKKGGEDLDEHMAKYESIKHSLDVIKSNVAEIERLKAKNKNASNDKVRKDIMNQLEDVMAATNKEGVKIKKTLDELKEENQVYAKEHKDSATKQMRENLYQTHIRRFHQIMNDYNSATLAFKKDIQNRTKREIKIVNSNISDEDVDRLVESGQAQDVIKQALNLDNIQDTVRVIEERHLDILKLEQQVLEVYELFRDLATLVDLQQESLDVIENRILHAKDYTEKAEVELQDAEEYQKKARSRTCCLICCLIGILIAILAPTLLSTVAKS